MFIFSQEVPPTILPPKVPRLQARHRQKVPAKVRVQRKKGKRRNLLVRRNFLIRRLLVRRRAKKSLRVQTTRVLRMNVKW